MLRTILAPRSARPLLAGLAIASSLQAAAAGATVRFEAPLVGYPARFSGLSWPTGLAIGDLNGDQVPDIPVVPANSGLGVLLGDGHGGFGAPVPASAFGNQSRFFAIGDFDGDSHADFAAVYGSDAAIYFGDGTGQGWTRVALPVESGIGVFSGDFDGDDQTDLAMFMQQTTSPYAYRLRTFLSRPGRTLAITTMDLPTIPSVIFAVRSADFDGDDLDDFVATNPYLGGDFAIGLSQGDGTFAMSLAAFANQGEVRSLDIGDANGDGLLDVAVGHRFGLAIHPGLGNGSFGAPEVFPIMYSSNTGIGLRDVTGDGLTDLVWSDHTTLSIQVRPGLGGGAFGAPVVSTVGKALLPLLLEDLNGDERLDVIGMDAGSDPSSGFGLPGILVALGDGSGRFGRPLAPLTLSGSITPQAADFDGDGTPDIAALIEGAPAASISLVRHTSGRTLVAQDTRLLPGPNWKVFTGDLDEDDRDDLIVSSSTVQWLRGSVDSLLLSAVPLPTTGSQLLAVADATGEGHLDLIASGPSQLLVRPGNGDGTFGSEIVALTGTTPSRAQVGDLNGDGQPDIAILGTSGAVAWARGLGSGQFATESVPLNFPTESPAAIALGDIDGDGRVDLLTSQTSNVVGSFFDAAIFVRYQLPNGTLAYPVQRLGLSDAARYETLMDLNADGRADLFARMGPGLSIGLGRGDGNFDVEARFDAFGWHDGFSGSVRAPVLADFDDDGFDDLVARHEVGPTRGIAIFYGRDPEPPTVSVLPPDWPIPLFVGMPTTIEWAAADNLGLGDAEIFVSRSGLRGPFARIGIAPATSGQFEWMVEGPTSDDVCFKVLVRDSHDNTSWARSSTMRVILPATAVDPEGVGPSGLRLAVRGSNPVHERLRLALHLPRESRAVLTLHDLQGRHLDTLVDGVFPAGDSNWDRLLSDLPARLQAGIYFVSLRCDGQRTVARFAVTD